MHYRLYRSGFPKADLTTYAPRLTYSYIQQITFFPQQLDT